MSDRNKNKIDDTNLQMKMLNYQTYSTLIMLYCVQVNFFLDNYDTNIDHLSDTVIID